MPYIDDVLHKSSAKNASTFVCTGGLLQSFSIAGQHSQDKFMVIGTHNKQIDVTFEGEPFGTINSYKYLGLEFSDNYKWNVCVERKILGLM